MKFFRWVFSRMGFKTKVAATGGGLVTAAMVSAAVFFADAQVAGSKMTKQFEGTVLGVYKDVVGVETWCAGETQTGRLPEGQEYTKEYCDQLFTARYTQYAAQLYSCYNDKMKRYVTPAIHASLVDVYYNAGAKCNSGMMRALKRGDSVGACEFMLRYRYAGGKDCSDRSNNCYGVYDRRVQFYDICIKDAEQIPPEGIGPDDAV